MSEFPFLLKLHQVQVDVQTDVMKQTPKLKLTFFQQILEITRPWVLLLAYLLTATLELWLASPPLG